MNAKTKTRAGRRVKVRKGPAPVESMRNDLVIRFAIPWLPIRDLD